MNELNNKSGLKKLHGIASLPSEVIFENEKKVNFMSLEIVHAKKCVVLSYTYIDLKLWPLVRS